MQHLRIAAGARAIGPRLPVVARCDVGNTTHCLTQAALDREQFELATELLRFLVPPGRHDAFLAATRQPREAKAALDTAAAGGQHP